MMPACLADDSAFWPDREDLSAEFMKLLAAAQEGGATIAECLLMARRIRRGDDLSWHREWKRLAGTNRDRGDAAFAAGHFATARRNWLRAINYYNAAALPLDPADQERSSMVLAMQACARSLVQASSPAGEIVTMPWVEGHALQGYFLPAPGATGPAPTVICIGEPGHRKEEFLFKLAPHARERGLSMLAIDLLGERGDGDLDRILRRRDLETSLSAVMDHLSSRADVDSTRVAVLADGWTSSFATRAIVHEPRLAAAVCDGGLWDLHERTFAANRIMLRDATLAGRPAASLIARDIGCPVLITLGDDGWLKADRARQMVQQVRAERPDLTLRVFTAEETAAGQGHADNPGLANEYIFDWLAAQLGTQPR